MRDDDDSYQPQAPTQTSPWAVISLIGGVGSLCATPMACCCPLSPLVIFPALLSIVVGHVALSQINSSDGGTGGKELAWIGLGTAYPAFFLNTALVAAFVIALVVSEQNKPAAPAMPPVPAAQNKQAQPNPTTLSQVELAILQQSRPGGLGTNPQAKTLAEQFLETLMTRRDKVFEEEGRNVPSDAQFVVWCELKPETCAFIVFARSYADYADDDKQKLAELCWDAAKQVTGEVLTEDAELAVGLRGELTWGKITTGVVDADGTVTEMESGTDVESLYPFFEAEQEFNLRPDQDAMDDAPAAPNRNEKQAEPAEELPSKAADAEGKPEAEAP